jgi:hypothetical protein
MIALIPTGLVGQSLGLAGEASLSGTASNASEGTQHLLVRYLPELEGALPLWGSLKLDFNASANLWASKAWGDGQGGDGTGEAELYRGWVRLSSPSAEVRAGLQKISYGSASIFRPLMWFDHVDPRDPLQLSEGVEAILGRAYLPENITLWGWAVRGQDEPKGWEMIPTNDGSVELGGRLQVPLGPGELATTFHHREMDLAALAVPGAETTGSENRFALDGKWDLGIGAWFEAVAIRQESPLLSGEWVRSVALGADYTFEIGNGLSVLAEHFWKENPALDTDGSDGVPEQPPTTDPGAPIPPELPTEDLNLTAFTVSYPYGVLDRIGLAIYRDWQNGEVFRMLEWRRTYDRWRFHVLGFWNPDDLILFPSGPGGPTGSGGTVPLSGAGVQLIVIFNH